MDALNWRKASYSASNGGCVEVGGDPDAVLVRDTQDRTGPVLRFSPGAWRRFAGQVKRSLAPEPYGGPRVSHCYKGTLGVWGRLGASRGIPRWLVRSAAGVPARQDLFSVCAWVGVVCESAVVRGARPRAGGGGRGSGETGNRALGGSGFPRCLQLPPAEESGLVCAYCRAQRGALGTFHGHPCWSCLAFSPVIRAAAAGVALQLPRSLVWWGPSVSAVPDWSPLVSGTRGVEMEVPRPRSHPV